MADRKESRLKRLGGALGRLSVPVIVVVGISVAAAAARTERFVESRASAAGILPVQVPPPFTHADHESVQCFTCHDTRDQHGALLVSTIQDCRSCHHSPPLTASCSRCHVTADTPDESFRIVRAVSFSVGTRDAARALVFPHQPHAAVDCARCHTQGTPLAVPATLDCAGCHEDHHTPTSDCASCHMAAPVTAHPPAEAHVTCSGAACHQRVPFESVPRTRELCLGCHQDMREHEAPRLCAECHSLPVPRPQAGGFQ